MAKVETDLDIARQIDDEANSFMPTMAMMLMGCSAPAKHWSWPPSCPLSSSPWPSRESERTSMA